MTQDNSTEPQLRNHQSKQWNSLRKALGFAYFLSACLFYLYMDFNDWWIDNKVNEIIGGSGYASTKLEGLILIVIAAIILYPLYWIVDKIILRKRDKSESTISFTSSADKLEFSFGYLVVNTVILEKTFIQVELGFQVFHFTLSQFCNYYLMPGSNKTQTLYFSYRTERGKLKNIPMIAVINDEQVKLLLEQLAIRFPGKSLNHLSRAEALKIMKVMNPTLLAAIVLFGVALIGVAIWYFKFR